MKLSNKILIGFFSLIVIYMIAAFTEIRFKGDLNQFDDSTSKVETEAFSKIGYIIIADLGEEVKVTTSEQPRIELRSKDGNVLSKLEYDIQGDTLSLLSFNLEEKEHAYLSIFVSGSDLKQIDIHEGRVVINDLNQTQLTISQRGGNLKFGDNNKLRKMRITAINNAYIVNNSFSLDTLWLEANNSDVRFYSGIERLEGSISNESFFIAGSVNEIQFKKDESSSWRLNN